MKIIKIMITFILTCQLSFAAMLSAPLTTRDGNILDSENNIISIKGVSWFGFNTETCMLHGLWSNDFETMLQQIKSLGFNAVRIPFQFNFILDENIKPSSITTNCNGPNSCNLNIPQQSAFVAFKWIVEQFTQNGFYVLLDDHYEDSTYVDNYQQWLNGWRKIAETFKNNQLVGYDLYNEPDAHGITWEGNNKKSWGDAILEVSDILYKIDHNKLIFIEGTAQGSLEANWGDGFATDETAISNNISNPKSFFNKLFSKPYINQIIISPHVYGPDGTNGQGQDHSNQQHAFSVWSRLFGYLQNNFSKVNNVSRSGFCLSNNQCHQFPIVIGEFGGKFDKHDQNYEKDYATNLNLTLFLNTLSANPSWFYWDWNPNSGNTGGILTNDWKTIDTTKVKFLRDNLGL